MFKFRFTPRVGLPSLEVGPDTLGIAIMACDAKRVNFIPIGYSLAIDGPLELKRRCCERSARVLLRVARNLALHQPEYSRELLTLAATLLASEGGVFHAE